ncbi:MAG: hypothetical protein RLZZ324_1306 [Candidatus Parcubacteria bacterium]|jgi:glycosyltransferase involved in cell wall biosynthesis
MSIIIGIDASRANALQKTGVERYAFEVIQRLKREIPAEYRVRLYSREPLQGALAELPTNWESAVLAWPPRRLWTQLRLSWEMYRRPPDLLFVPAHVLPPLLPRRSVVTMHDVAFMPFPRAYTPHGALYLRADAMLAVRRATRILTVSEFSKREIAKWFGAAPEKISVTPLAYDAAQYHAVPKEEAARVAAKRGLNGPYFLFVGRLERKKNLGGLFAAFREYKSVHPRAAESLALVGGRGRGFAHEHHALDGWPGAARAVRELGFVPQEDVAALYAGATALVLPSWYEGFGLPVIEAFACGTPVIAARAASLPEVAGDAALLVDPARPHELADALSRLAEDAALRADLVRRGHERVKAFSWDACARGTWEAMKAALEDGAPARAEDAHRG